MTDTDLMAEFEAEFASLDPDSRGRRDVMNKRGSRYALPRRDGTPKPGGWMRATNFAGAISDQYALMDWGTRTDLLGIKDFPEIIDELTLENFENKSADEIRDILDSYARRIRMAGKGGLGAQRGNIRHAIVQAEHVGLPLNVRPRLHAQLNSYKSALADAGLIAVPGMQERLVLVERYEVCGRLDNVLQDLYWGVYRIGDLKTQRRFYAWLEIVIQLHLYATSDAVFNEQTWAWEDWPVRIDPTTALVAWMPHEHPERENGVDVYEVDIWRGKELADLAYRVIQARSAAKSARAPWGRVRAQGEGVVALSERWARRAAEAESMDELRAIAAGARQAGVWEVVKTAVISREQALRTP